MHVLLFGKINVRSNPGPKEGLDFALPVSPHLLCHVLFGLKFQDQAVISVLGFFPDPCQLWREPA